MPFVIALLNALAAIPAILGTVERFCATIVGWYVARQKADVLAAIADAAALGARAKTQEERILVATAWQKALSKPRTSA